MTEDTKFWSLPGCKTYTIVKDSREVTNSGGSDPTTTGPRGSDLTLDVPSVWGKEGRVLLLSSLSLSLTGSYVSFSHRLDSTLNLGLYVPRLWMGLTPLS